MTRFSKIREQHNNWTTPVEFYRILDKEFNFNYDPCPLNEKVTYYENTLETEWGTSCFVNPPYSKVLKEKFVYKSILESQKGKTVVMLLPVSTSTKLFHDYILKHAFEIRFIRGRIRFSESANNPMHDSMVVIFKNQDYDDEYLLFN